MNNAAMNVCVQVFVWACIFNSPEDIPGGKLLSHMLTLGLTF